MFLRIRRTTDAEWWSTQDIFEYLLPCHLPTSEHGSGDNSVAIAGDLSVPAAVGSADAERESIKYRSTS